MTLKRLNQVVASAVLALTGLVFTAFDAYAGEGLSVIDIISWSSRVAWVNGNRVVRRKRPRRGLCVHRGRDILA